MSRVNAPTTDEEKASDERTKRAIERWHGKQALADTWRKLDPVYSHRLQSEADKLKHQLVMKGVL